MKYIGIKKLWYGEVIKEAVTGATLKTWLSTASEVKNSHDGTFSYSQDDPSTTDYKNEITGKLYHRDVEDGGNKTINFTIGEYEFQTKADLQGGKATAESWSAPASPELIYKGMVALTKTGVYIVFTNASIIGKVDMQQKALGLGVTAVAMSSETEGVMDEYWVAGTAVK